MADVKLYYQLSRNNVAGSNNNKARMKLLDVGRLNTSLAKSVRTRLRKSLGRFKKSKSQRKVKVRHSNLNHVKTPSKSLDCRDATFMALESRAFNCNRNESVLKSKDEVLQRREDLIKALVETLEVDDTPHLRSRLHASLQDSQWDVEQTLQRLDGQLESLSITLEEEKSADGVECQVCYETVPPERADSLGCGHRFCTDCWEAFVSTKIHSGRDFYSACCMEPKCQVLVPTEFFRKHANASDSARLDQLVSNTFVDACGRLTWCRRPGCENVIELPPDVVEKARGFGHSIECSCGFKFCFLCGEDEHNPATCEQVRLWEEELASASSAADMKQVPRAKQDLALAKRWVLNHTRPCPACKAPIEKNKGCNHMICPGCKHEFCWLCLSSWEKHSSTTGGFFRCSMYDQDKDGASKLAEEFQSTDREEFIRIRIEAQKERQKNAEDDKAFFIAQAKRRRVQYFQEKSDCHQETKEWKRVVGEAIEEYARVFVLADDKRFFRKVGKLIQECHGALKWSYVVAYFLNDPILTREWFIEHRQQYLVLFENIPGETCPNYALFVLAQGNLEGLTEILTDALVSPLMSPASAPDNRGMIARGKIGSGVPLLGVSPVEYKNKLREISLKAKKQIELLGDLAKQLQQSIPRLAAGLHQVSKVGSVSWACDECGYNNDGSSKECIMCASQFTLNYFTRCRKALTRQVHCVRCNAMLSKPKESGNSLTEGYTCLAEVECSECGHKAFELYDGKENVEQAEEEEMLFEGELGSLSNQRV